MDTVAKQVELYIEEVEDQYLFYFFLPNGRRFNFLKIDLSVTEVDNFTAILVTGIEDKTDGPR